MVSSTLKTERDQTIYLKELLFEVALIIQLGQALGLLVQVD